MPALLCIARHVSATEAWRASGPARRSRRTTPQSRDVTESISQERRQFCRNSDHLTAHSASQPKFSRVYVWHFDCLATMRTQQTRLEHRYLLCISRSGQPAWSTAFCSRSKDAWYGCSTKRPYHRVLQMKSRVRWQDPLVEARLRDRHEKNSVFNEHRVVHYLGRHLRLPSCRGGCPSSYALGRQRGHSE